MIADTAFAAWKERAAAAPIDEVARRLGATLRKVTKAEWAGPCPSCGGTDRFSINLRKGVFNCRGAAGGDVIGMVRHVLGLEFIAVCEWIIGEPPPDRDSALTEEDRAALDRAAAARKAADERKAADDNAFRERERGTLYDIWRSAEAGAPEIVDYLEIRLGPAILDVPQAERPRLRLVRDMPYYRHGGDRGEILARAPAMVAPLVDAASKFRGLHFTYLDLSRPNGKLRLPDPAAPDRLLPAKKVRGSKQGFWIDLFPHSRSSHPSPVSPHCGSTPSPRAERGCSRVQPNEGMPKSGTPDLGRGEGWGEGQAGEGAERSEAGGGAPRTLVIGEGIEKTLAVWLALRLAGRDLAGWGFFVAGDLGNLAGKAVRSARHPWRRHEKSERPVMVAGPEPDMAAPAIVIPDDVANLLLLGDSTSDPFTTRCALARASARYARAGRCVRVAWAPEGVDFDDVLRGTE